MATTRFAVLWFCTTCLGGMIFAVIGGCTSNDNGGALLPAPKTIVTDIPVPTSFDLEELRSRTFDNGEFRYIDLLYKGSGSAESVKEFYVHQMPITRWEPQTKRTSQGQTLIEYAKGNERCQVTIYGGGTFKSTYIHIVAWPINKNHRQPKTSAKNQINRRF